MEFLATKWLWLYAGAILMFLELSAPGFVIFFFGLAAATVGGVLFLCPLSVTGQVVLFTVLSIAYLFGLRRYVKSVFRGETAGMKSLQSEYVGRLGEVVEPITPTLPGRILLGDAEWAARATVPLAVGARVRVVGQENLTLAVEAI